MKKIVASSPHFLVKDVVVAGTYYEQKLGFTIAEYWGDPPTFAMPHRDNFIVMLNQVDRLSPNPNGREEVWDAYFWCTGIDELHDEYIRSRARIYHEPVNRESYGLREMAVHDIDGYLLVFAENLAEA